MSGQNGHVVYWGGRSADLVYALGETLAAFLGHYLLASWRQQI
jgi:hypothetical protein